MICSRTARCLPAKRRSAVSRRTRKSPRTSPSVASCLTLLPRRAEPFAPPPSLLVTQLFSPHCYLQALYHPDRCWSTLGAFVSSLRNQPPVRAISHQSAQSRHTVHLTSSLTGCSGNSPEKHRREFDIPGPRLSRRCDGWRECELACVPLFAFRKERESTDSFRESALGAAWMRS
eukprot:4566863-Pleurochrysis_carterae.AAC.2